MSKKKLTPTQLANQLEEHAKTAEIIFGKQYRSDTERQSAAELRRLDAVNRELLKALKLADLDFQLDGYHNEGKRRRHILAAIAKATDV